MSVLRNSDLVRFQGSDNHTNGCPHREHVSRRAEGGNSGSMPYLALLWQVRVAVSPESAGQEPRQCQEMTFKLNRLGNCGYIFAASGYLMRAGVFWENLVSDAHK